MYFWVDAAHTLIRSEDGRSIPAATGNRDYAEVEAWVSAGNTIGAYVAPGLSSWHVNAERDRRLLTVPYGGKLYDFVDGKGSDLNVAGAGTMALAAIIAGAQAGDLRWANPDRDFRWLAADNSSTTMDAFQCLAFAKAAGVWKERHIFAARALKDMSPIPSDYTADSYWT